MSVDDEQKLLNDAIKVVREQAFYMKRAMDSDSLDTALEHAIEMLREMRTSLLSPKTYYELYMRVMDEMREFEDYLVALQRNGKPIVQIYEKVQNCSNIVPRLYLMVCVGGVYIASLEAPAKDILKDLVEMIKGVQQPMRGLFLRHYLTQCTKNRLPDVGSPYEGAGGNVQDSYTFLIQNFIETNRLWVRLQTQGAAKDKKKREKERLDLRILVGANLVRLSQIDGLDVSDYKENVLPKILEEIVSCKDTIAQNYLMDCIIQVFPDEFHLATLDKFLETCPQLKEKVNVRSILETIMDRLAQYTANSGQSIPPEINAFKLFNDCIKTLIENRSNMTLPESLRLQTGLINFALKCYASRIDYVAHCLNTCNSLIEKSGFVETTRNNAANQTERSTDETTTQIETLLSAPLSNLALRVLEIPSFGVLMSYLPWGNWKEVSLTFLRSVVSKNASLSEVEQVDQLFTTITPLIRDRDGTVNAVDEDGREAPISPEFIQEQHLVSKVVHLMKNDDTDVLLKIYGVTRKHFTTGGPQRMKYTLAPLVFRSLNLARRVFLREKAAETDSDSAPQFSSRKVLQFVIEVLTAMSSTHPELSLQLFLQAAQAADECKFHAIAYEFVKEALLLYESEITDSKVQNRVLLSMIGTLLNCRSFPTEDYEALITKVAQYSNKLLKKPDQCKMITLCSHLFWPRNGSDESGTQYSDPNRVLECLQRALKVASNTSSTLFVDILDRYVYYFENDNPAIEARFVSGLIGLIKDQLSSDPNSCPAIESHYRSTLDYLSNRQKNAETSEKYGAIEL